MNEWIYATFVYIQAELTIIIYQPSSTISVSCPDLFQYKNYEYFTSQQGHT